jgi:formylglycine-generating enzyme required for sulfatase activity
MISVTDTSRMVKIPAGPFLMGTNSAIAYPADGEGPQRSVWLDEFWIDETSVTNLDFSEFVQATGYQTEAEIVGWSFVPAYLISELDNRHVVGQSENTPWWMGVNGADWLHPIGPNSSIAEILDHPVVHISWNDANSFAQWSGKRLPTEAEWEKAARGGNENSVYPWGDELNLDGEFACNIWQGEFPDFNSGDDGYIGTAPVYSFAQNGYGLYNVCGNVWEWCMDWWSDNSHYRNNYQQISNPSGPTSGDNKVIKGGSYLCHDSYCNRYRISARTSHPKNGFTAHIGFRCVTDKKIELLGSL